MRRPLELLTQRQLDVLELAAMGLTTAQIGERLWLSSETVKTHLKQISWRLCSRNRTHAVVIALREGLIDFPPIGGSA